MIAIIFEVWPKDGSLDAYLDIAAELREELAGIDGFISVERFQSLTDEGKLLSLSFWRDEAAVKQWRHHAQHRIAQAKGRRDLFSGYRLRVAGIIRDYGMNEREQAPQDAISI